MHLIKRLVNKKPKKKRSGKKITILVTFLLAGKLLFGGFRDSPSGNSSSPLLHEKVVIALVRDNNKIVLSEKQMDFIELRGGDLHDWLWIAIFVTWMNYIESFYMPPPRVIVPPHLEWMYKQQPPGRDFGYGKGAGPRSIKVTQNAASEKPSSGPYNYQDVMDELQKQRNKTTFDIQVGDQIYTIENPERKYATELESVLAEKMYDSIRELNTDLK